MSLRKTCSNIWKCLGDPGRFELTEALFLRLLGLIYLTAFVSLWPQIEGLAGSRGIVPATQVLYAAHAEAGARAYFLLPTVFWLGISDAALVWVCIIGCVAALLLIIGVVSRWSALICFILYLSLVSIGQPFTAFQWDALLLETGFLALFSGAPWIVWAYRLLLFRLMFESGLVKLLSHDPSWSSLHALRFHFMTQPLPVPLAYYVYRAPTWLLDSFTAATLAIELGAPLLLFGPRRFRHIGVGLLMLLQVAIILTGNYAFFNLLALSLCLWGLDEQTFAPLARFLRRRVHLAHPIALRRCLNVALAVLMVLGVVTLIGMFAPRFEKPVSRVLVRIAPFEIVNTYGLFAVMTTTRPEVVIEGSNDLVHWKEYSFRYKPGNLHRGLPLVAPYQPRLDWQMWFAALGDYQRNSWVGGLLYRLLQGDPVVIGLMQPAPFPQPPHYVRALLYKYDFTTPAERSRSGAVWKRELLRTWLGPVSLTGQ